MLKANHLSASAPELQRHVTSLTKHNDSVVLFAYLFFDLLVVLPSIVQRWQRTRVAQVESFPNAVSTLLFRPSMHHRRPSDMPWTDGPILLYAGSLWGSWFDWILIEKLAAAYPKVRREVHGGRALQ